MQAINDIKFLNDYNEVAHENLIAIIKQNLFFQTQIKGLEEKVKLIPQLEEKLKEVTLKKEEFQLSVRTLNLMIKMGHTNLKSVVKNLQKNLQII